MSLPTYSDHKYSGVEWLGEIPAHWAADRLKNHVKLVAEKAIDQTNPVALENIESWSGKLIETGTHFLSDGISFCAGDVLFGKLRPYLAKVHAAETSGEAVGDFHVLRPQPSVNSRFLAYHLLAREVISVISGSTYGSKMPRVNWEHMAALRMAFPPLEEQAAIAAFLDRETAKIDALIAEQQRLIELLKEKRQAVISHAVTKGLNPNVPMKDSGIEWLGEVPAHWIITPIRRVARLESGHTPSRSRPEWWENCSIPWFTLADVWQLRDDDKEYVFETKELVSELGLRNSSARLLPKGTVILSRTASVGYSAIMGVDMATTQDFANWICGSELIPEYLLYCFRGMAAEFDRLKMGSTHNTIYMPDIRSVTIAIPPVNEQSEVVQHMRRELENISCLILNIKTSIDLLRERRSALISAAVTGKIDVRDLAEHRDAAE